MKLFKERIPDGRCAYKTGEFEIATLLSFVSVGVILLYITGLVNSYLGFFIIILSMMVATYIDFNELRRRKEIIEDKKK